MNNAALTSAEVDNLSHDFQSMTFRHRAVDRVVNFSLPFSKWIEEVLRRSGASLIDVGDEERLVTRHSTSRLTEHASRIRSLFISLPKRPWGSFDGYWQDPMPLLEVFSLTWQSWLETRMDTTTFKILPKTLFNTCEVSV